MADYTILIVDYNPRSVESIRTPLERAGYRVEVAADGIAGIRAFERLEPDLTLVEAMLPKKHGFEVCQELKQTSHGKKSPVFIVTGVYRGRKYRHQAMHQHGCDRYLEKPLTDRQLLDAVQAYLPSPLPAETPAAVAVEAAAEAAPGGAASGQRRPGAKREPQPSPSSGAAAHRDDAETDPDFEAAELEIMSQLDNLFSDDPPRDSNAEV